MTCHRCNGTGEVHFISQSTGDWERDACTHCLNFEEQFVRPAAITRCPGDECKLKMHCARYLAVKAGGRAGALFAFAPFASDTECGQFVEERWKERGKPAADAPRDG